MIKQKVAIIGLGRIGSAFLRAMQQKNINVVCVAERINTPAKAKAAAAGIKIATLEDIVDMGDMVDIIFDLTGILAVRKELRKKLKASNNKHTVIAPETIVHLIWSLISEEALPSIEGRKTGY